MISRFLVVFAASKKGAFSFHEAHPSKKKCFQVNAFFALADWESLKLTRSWWTALRLG